jgi:hypothetical protein
VHGNLAGPPVEVAREVDVGAAVTLQADQRRQTLDQHECRDIN